MLGLSLHNRTYGDRRTEARGNMWPLQCFSDTSSRLANLFKWLVRIISGGIGLGSKSVLVELQLVHIQFGEVVNTYTDVKYYVAVEWSQNKAHFFLDL